MSLFRESRGFSCFLFSSPSHSASARHRIGCMIHLVIYYSVTHQHTCGLYVNRPRLSFELLYSRLARVLSFPGKKGTRFARRVCRFLWETCIGLWLPFGFSAFNARSFYTTHIYFIIFSYHIFILLFAFAEEATTENFIEVRDNLGN